MRSEGVSGDDVGTIGNTDRCGGVVVVEVEETNTGAIAGAQVVQVYVSLRTPFGQPGP